MPRDPRSPLAMILNTAREWWSDECPREAAALSYYTVFSLPPLLVLIMMVAGGFWDPAEVETALRSQLGSAMGTAAEEGIDTILKEAEQPEGRGVLPTMLGIAALLFGATGAFISFQGALNRVWEIEPDPAQGGIRNFLLKRLLSLGMILVVGFLLLVSLALSAALAAAGESLDARLPNVSDTLLHAVNIVVSLAIITGLFAALFKVLPDAEIGWRDVWVGAIATSLLFVLGKYAIGLYLGRNEPQSAYGAAGSLAVLLLWVYYASMLVLFGAEFTKTWAKVRGSGINPEDGASRVKEKKQRLRGAEERRKAREETGRTPPRSETIEK